MGTIRSLDDIELLKQQILAEKRKLSEQGLIDIVVGMGSCGIAAGACETLEAFHEIKARQKIEKIRISQTGCIGLCKEEPIVEVHTSDGRKTTYAHVTPNVAERIIREHILAGNVVQDHVVNF